MKTKMCLCGRIAHRWKLGGYVCLRCDMIEKKNQKMFAECLEGNLSGKRGRAKNSDIVPEIGVLSLSIR